MAARWGLRVVVDRLDRLDAVLGAAAQAGVEGTPLVLLENTRGGQARITATEQAVAQARQQAEAMARAAGGRLGPLISLTSMSNFDGSDPSNRFFMAGGFERGASLVPSNVAVRASVQATWRFIPR